MNIVLISFFGRANVNLYDKYNLTATIRQDGSSKFGDNYKRAIFPSLAAGWTISNESFLKESKTLSYLKLRVGWGQTGNSENIRPYGSKLLYGQTTNYYDGSAGIQNFVPGYGIVQNANPNLKWEVIEQTNIGIDFGLFGGRVNGTFEVYNKATKGLLFNYNVPADGINYFVDNITANVGKMSNKGWEISLNSDVVKKDNFSWNVRIVSSGYVNEISSLQNSEYKVGIIRYNAFGGRGLSEVYSSRLREGHAYGEFYIPRFAGFGKSDDGKNDNAVIITSNWRWSY